MRRTAAIAIFFALFTVSAGTAGAVPPGPTVVQQPTLTAKPQPPAGPTVIADPTDAPDPHPTDDPTPTEDPALSDNPSTTEPAPTGETVVDASAPTRKPADDTVRSQNTARPGVLANDPANAILLSASVLLLLGSSVVLTWLVASRRSR